MKKTLNTALLIAISLFLNSCYYDVFPEETTDNPIEPTEDVSYATDITPILANCVGCHTSSSTLNLTDNTYTNLLKNVVVSGDSDQSKLYTYFSEGGHSVNGYTLNATDIALIKDWIDQGALNN